MQIRDRVSQDQPRECTVLPGETGKEGRSTLDGLGPSRAHLDSAAEAGALSSELLQWG